jgi:hypothetical protein
MDEVILLHHLIIQECEFITYLYNFIVIILSYYVRRLKFTTNKQKHYKQYENRMTSMHRTTVWNFVCVFVFRKN